MCMSHLCGVFDIQCEGVEVLRVFPQVSHVIFAAHPEISISAASLQFIQLLLKVSDLREHSSRSISISMTGAQKGQCTRDSQTLPPPVFQSWQGLNLSSAACVSPVLSQTRPATKHKQTHFRSVCAGHMRRELFDAGPSVFQCCTWADGALYAGGTTAAGFGWAGALLWAARDNTTTQQDFTS